MDRHDIFQPTKQKPNLLDFDHFWPDVCDTESVEFSDYVRLCTIWGGSEDVYTVSAHVSPKKTASIVKSPLLLLCEMQVANPDSGCPNRFLAEGTASVGIGS